MFFSKEINRESNVKHLLLRKTDVLKTCRESKFLEKKIGKNALALKSKKVQDIFEEHLFWHYYQSSLSNEVNFRDIMKVFQNILAKN